MSPAVGKKSKQKWKGNSIEGSEILRSIIILYTVRNQPYEDTYYNKGHYAQKRISKQILQELALIADTLGQKIGYGNHEVEHIENKIHCHKNSPTRRAFFYKAFPSIKPCQSTFGGTL